jgi:hypothetical protein
MAGLTGFRLARVAQLPAAVRRHPRPDRRQRRLGGDVLLVVAAVVAATCSYSTTSAPYNQLAIVVGAVATVVGVTRFGVGAPHRLAVLGALLITLVPQTLRPPSPNVSQSAFYPWSVALGVASVLLILLSLLPWRAPLRGYGRPAGYARLRAPLLVAATLSMMVAVLITVPGGRRPQIDVWSIFQQSAAGLFHGINPYEVTSFSVPAGQTANCFNYLPVSFLTSWIGWFTVGDVRYAETLVMLAGWLALGGLIVARTRQRPDARFEALTLLLTAVTLAGTLRVAQQAWNESLIIGYLLIGVALLGTRRAGWAWLPIALALATKQHVVLILPLLALWPSVGWRRTLHAVAGAVLISAPWVLWNFERFTTCTVDFFLTIEPRHDSISLWRFVPHPLQNVAVLGGLIVGFVLALRFVPKTLGGLLVACGLVLMGFDLSNKQTFENQWWLFAELIVCGLALHGVEVRRPGRREEAEHPGAAGPTAAASERPGL